MEKVTKTQMAIQFFKSGDLKKCLSIVKTFRIGFTKEQIRKIQIASECLNGNGKFYTQLGIDTERMISEATEIVRVRYSN